MHLKNVSPGFDEFWSTYPSLRKGSKTKCIQLWIKNDCEQQTGTIIAHVKSMIEINTPQFCPAPLVYLRQERWDGAEVTNEWEGAL